MQIQVQNNDRMSLEQWALKFGVSTKWDYNKFENKEFLKRLDEAKSIWKPKNETKHN